VLNNEGLIARLITSLIRSLITPLIALITPHSDHAID